MGFQDLCLYPVLSRPGILNNKIPGLSRVCTNPVTGPQIGFNVSGTANLLKKMSSLLISGTVPGTNYKCRKSFSSP